MSLSCSTIFININARGLLLLRGKTGRIGSTTAEETILFMPV